MTNNNADPDDSGRNDFGELDAFQDFDNPDNTPTSSEQEAQELTVPVIHRGVGSAAPTQAPPQRARLS